jgi:threonine aldolase
LRAGQLDGADPAEPLSMRLVCDWSVSEAAIDSFVEAARG